jgi:hypothetical protein
MEDETTERFWHFAVNKMPRASAHVGSMVIDPLHLEGNNTGHRLLVIQEQCNLSLTLALLLC